MLVQHAFEISKTGLIEPEIPDRTLPQLPDGVWGINAAAARGVHPDKGLQIYIHPWSQMGRGDDCELLLDGNVVDQYTIIKDVDIGQRVTLYVAPRHLTATKNTQDVSSCAGQGVTDAAGWLIHFQQQDQQPQRQCSLSSLVPSQFMASLTAHQGIDDDWSIQPTQLQVRNWDSDAPGQIPIQALFYDATKTGAMLGAQKDQRDYFNATGDWLPVLRMDLTQAPDAVFGFDQQDQLYIGYQLASRLNDRYTETSPTCQNGKTAYYCNGVLLRGTQASTAFHMWNPSPGSVANNGVSFTYLRVDAALTKPVFKQGFIVRESAAPTATLLTVMCAYPFDGATAVPVEDTCRIRSGMCNELGVTDVQAWASRYAASPGSSCAFNIDPAQFQLNIDVRPSVPNGDGWNEVMIRTWPQNIPLQIPLEAFFYSLNAYFDSDGLPQAQFGQRDYFETTGRFLPIVKLELEAADGRVFSYNPQEQIAPGAPAAILIVPGSDL
ncbi:hypothetical protein EMIT0347P_150001 [Pseudomonas sp. IT-347P]